MNNEISGKTLLSVTASIAAAIIPDTPIVSIAGATLSEITTTTTSTTTTPTPAPTPTSFTSSIKEANKDSIVNLSNNPMSDAATTKSAGGNGINTANATAITNTLTNTSNPTAVADAGGITGKNSITEHASIVNAAAASSAGKTDDPTTNATTTTIDTKKSDVSDLEEPDLKKLLEEAYTYKTPKDKKDKSEIFLDLLQKVENEDLGIISTRSDSHRHHPHSQSRHQQKQGGSLQDLLQLPPDYRRQNHTSRHKKNSSVSSRQREGGSLPSNVNVANCLLNSFEQQASVYADKRVRRAFLLGVESGTVSLNSNNTLVGVANSGNNAASGPVIISSNSSSSNSTSLCSKESGNSVGANVTNVSGVGGGGGNMATKASGHNVGGTIATGAGIVNTTMNTTNSIKNTGDYIINIGDMIDIQQQQQILPSKAQDGGQGMPFYERVDIDMRIPRPSLHRGDVDFAPARSHHYVDEVIRFHQIDGGESGLCESGEVAISVNTLGNTLKSAAASCSLPMPLDERYRSIKSVMGEKGDTTGPNVNSTLASKTTGTTAQNSGNSNSIVNNNGNSVGGGTSSIGIGNYAKTLPLSRQTDENGNDCERQQHSSSNIISSAGQSQAKTKAKKKPQKDNTIPVDVENEAGYRGKDPVEVLLKFIESTEEDNKQGSGGGSNSNKFSENSKKKERKKEKVKQNKMKKSNSLEELRSCAKIDVGELKQSAATTENNNVTMRSKGAAGGGGSGGSGGGGKGSKNNSASTADINKNFDGSNKEVAATAANSGGNKQVNAVAATSSTTTAAPNNRKGERRSWGTEELQYLGTDSNAGGAGSGSLANNTEEKVKEKKEKKSKDKEKDKERDGEKDKIKDKDKEREKEKDKDADKNEKCITNKLDRHDKNEKFEKTEKTEKTDKLEKRKKSENNIQSSTTPIKPTTANITNTDYQGNNSTPIVSAIDLLSMNTLISETAEFHVVTKKKKPKKQRASIDDSHFTSGSNYNSYNNNNNNTNTGTIGGGSGGFTRSHNSFSNAQKGGNNNGSTFGNQQQQQSRYKHYNNNTSHGFNTYGNGGNNYNNTNNNNISRDSDSSGGGRIDYHNNYNSNYNNNYNSINSNNTIHTQQQYGQHHHQHHPHQQHQQQQHQHQQQHQNQQQHMNAHNTSNAGGAGSTDKSRRKSTSSVPPSEKSDSSDIDSVHSLPIESTAAATNKGKQRHKPPTSSNTTTPETPKSSNSSGSPGSAPISYAHIAAAAAVDRWPSLDVANNNTVTNSNSSNSNSNTTPNGNVLSNVAHNISDQPQQHLVANAESTPASLTNAINATVAPTVTSTTTNPSTKVNKNKKLASKPDFPELVASNAMNATISETNKLAANPIGGVTAVTGGALKTISYSQSLVAAPVQLNSASNPVAAAITASATEKVTITTVEVGSVSIAAAASSHAVQDANKIEAINIGTTVATAAATTTRLPQHQTVAQHHPPLQQQQQQPHYQQQQQQTLQKSKSVENDSYSFNSSNLDQQYPALEKTVKRHSTTNVSVATPTAAAIIPNPNTAGFNSGGNSSANITSINSPAVPTTTNTTTNSGKFNFAAAAKQLPNKSVIGCQPSASTTITTPLNTQEALMAQLTHSTVTAAAAITTSSTNYSIATTPAATAAPAPSNAVPLATATTTRKLKEKSLTSAFASVAQIPSNIVTAIQPAVAVPTTTNNISTANVTDSSAINTTVTAALTRKSKKEKAHQQIAVEAAELTNVAQKSSTATQTQSPSMMDAIVAGNKSIRSQATYATTTKSEKVVTSPQPHVLGKTQRQQTANSNSINTSNNNNISSGTTNTASTAASNANRPAVIILNDDRSGDSGIEFTFGDFNEDELKFFDDTIAEDECTADEYSSVTYDDDTSTIQRSPQERPSSTAEPNIVVATKSIDATVSANAAYFQSSQSGVIANAKRSTSAYAESGAASSSQPSIAISPENVKREVSNAKEDGNNKLKGRIGDKAAVENSEDYSENLKNVPATSTPHTEQQTQDQLQQRRNSETLQLQQLDTCNDIENAIIAAARAAAHQQPTQTQVQSQSQSQPPSQQHQHQQQQQQPRSYRHKHQQQQQQQQHHQYRSTSYGNAYEPPTQRDHHHRSQSSYAVRDMPNHYQPQQHQHQHQHQHHYHNQYHQQHQQQHYHNYHQSGSNNSGASRSRSSSSSANNNNNTNSFDATGTGSTPSPPQSQQSQSPNPSMGIVNIQRKEFDINFIPPTMSSAHSALQHNEIIVDFIGSAWEEVSKVTKFYEGQ